MKVSQRLDLISKIGRELQDRYTFTDLYAYLGAYGVSKLDDGADYSKWVYTKEALATISNDVILDIARDLDIKIDFVELPSGSKDTPTPPHHWKAPNKFRLFISHISKDKLIAQKLSGALSKHSISGFVAHEDIQPTALWEDEILRALNTMDALVAVHTEGFSKSVWTQQEIGFALGRGIKVISFKMGEDPTGFLSRRQALARRRHTAEEVASKIRDLLFEDERTSFKIAQARTTGAT